MLARALLARREALAWIAFADGAVVTLHGGHTGADRNDLLNAVVDRYNQRGRIYRVTTDSIEEARAASPTSRPWSCSRTSSPPRSSS